MAANRVRHLPVIDDEGRICGILSGRDRQGRPIGMVSYVDLLRDFFA